MNPYKIGIALAGIATLAILVWNITNGDEKNDSNTPSVVPSDQEGLEEKLAELERSNKRMMQRMTVMELRSSSQDAPSDDIAEEDVPPEEEQDMDAEERQEMNREKDEMMVQRTISTMEAAVSAQADDSQWTNRAKDSLYGMMETDAFPGTAVDDVACKESLCKISLSHDNHEDFEQFRSRGGGSGPIIGSFFFSYNPDTGKSTFYVAKEGQELPQVAPI